MRGVPIIHGVGQGINGDPGLMILRSPLYAGPCPLGEPRFYHMAHTGALGPETQDVEAGDARGFPKMNSREGRAGWEPTASASHRLQDGAGLGRPGDVTEKPKVDWF